METQRSVREKTSLRVGGAKRFVVAFRQYGTYLNAPIRWEATIDCGSRIEATSIAQRQARKLDAVYEGTMEWG